MSINAFENAHKFQLVSLSKGYRINDFECEVLKYKEFLLNEAFHLQVSGVSKTHLLINKENADIVAYMTLITDSIKLTREEKKVHGLESVIFGTFPALKIGQLAVNKKYKDLGYKGIGSLMIELAIGFAFQINENGVACKFITLDADIDNNPSVIKFYEKNGFKPNQKYNNKTKTVSMRLHIFGDDNLDIIINTGT